MNIQKKTKIMVFAPCSKNMMILEVLRFSHVTFMFNLDTRVNRAKWFDVNHLNYKFYCVIYKSIT